MRAKGLQESWEDIEGVLYHQDLFFILEAIRTELISQYHNNPLAQDFQNQAYDKSTKPKSYASGNKVWLNSKYIKIKRNRKLKAKFFRPFQVLYPVEKPAYKLKLPKKWRIYDVFHVLLLKQNITRKGRVDQKGAGRWECNKIWGWQQQGIQRKKNLRYYGLYKRVNSKSSTWTLLTDILKGLP